MVEDAALDSERLMWQPQHAFVSNYALSCWARDSLCSGCSKSLGIGRSGQGTASSSSLRWIPYQNHAGPKRWVPSAAFASYLPKPVNQAKRKVDIFWRTEHHCKFHSESPQKLSQTELLCPARAGIGLLRRQECVDSQ